ncbi:MAG: hypothetical protein KDA85_11350, partial [Planctomycetaceae bacterium]|nr:hypothetical protein [Planctomycetaceae bacterium]
AGGVDSTFGEASLPPFDPKPKGRRRRCIDANGGAFGFGATEQLCIKETPTVISDAAAQIHTG